MQEMRQRQRQVTHLQKRLSDRARAADRQTVGTYTLHLLSCLLVNAPISILVHVVQVALRPTVLIEAPVIFLRPRKKSDSTLRKATRISFHEAFLFINVSSMTVA